MNYFRPAQTAVQLHVTRGDGRIRPSSRAKLGCLTKYATRRI